MTEDHGEGKFLKFIIYSYEAVNSATILCGYEAKL